MFPERKPKLGMVLGSCSARGWAHVGVIRARHEEGVVADMMTGASIGAFVGAAYAIPASIAMPGIFTPALYDGEVMVDGALVNSVSVSLCRAMGAEVGIAVDLIGDFLSQA